MNKKDQFLLWLDEKEKFATPLEGEPTFIQGAKLDLLREMREKFIQIFGD